MGDVDVGEIIALELPRLAERERERPVLTCSRARIEVSEWWGRRPYRCWGERLVDGISELTRVGVARTSGTGVVAIAVINYDGCGNDVS